jgi:hypothetical protein
MAKLVSRSIWGVVPDPPKRKQEVRPAMIRGSAVAVSDTLLLANCAVVGGHPKVGIVRHNKYRIARVLAADQGRSVCMLSAPDAPLNIATGSRWCGNLRVGEPVYAAVSRTSARVEVTQGRLTAKRSKGDSCGLETSLVLPSEVRSAVLFDGHGRLIGVGSGDPAGGMLASAEDGPQVVPDLGNRDLKQPTARLAAPAAGWRAGPSP